LAQYEKGIEGLLSDIQSAIGNTSPLEDNAGSVVDVFEVSLAGGINLVGAHKVYIRKVNGRGFIIGKNQNGLGYIGTNSSKVRAKPIGHSKSQFMGVK